MSLLNSCCLQLRVGLVGDDVRVCFCPSSDVLDLQTCNAESQPVKLPG